MVTEHKTAAIPMYSSFSTFTTFLDWVKGMGILPSQIDRSLWKGKFAGGVGGQLMTGLKFLRLLDGNRPTPRLEELAFADPDQRKTMLKELLREVYGAELVDGLQRTTPAVFSKAIEELGTTDATHRKAESFFIQAAKEAGIAIAPSIAKKARAKPNKRKGKAPADNKKLEGEVTPKRERQHHSDDGVSRKVDLKSGGHIAMSFSFNPFELSAEDRSFVFELIDRLREYEEKKTAVGSPNGSGNL